MQASTAQIPLEIYLHFPWCKKKCPYCDFNSHAEKNDVSHAAYLEVLLADLHHELTQVSERTLISVYCGGGTPSLFSPEEIQRVIEFLEQSGRLSLDAEITLEANPGTIERGRFAAYRDAGINRVSLGAQSFDTDTLHRIGRIHAVTDVYRSVEELHAAGIQNFNIDLMFGLPGQSPEMAAFDLNEAVKLQPVHISRYQLTLEPNTLFYAYPPTLPDEDKIAHMEEAGKEFLDANGWRQYEVSAWSLPGSECRHNLNYWRFGDYLGVGAGAHGKIAEPDQARCQRRVKPRHPDDYMGRNGPTRQQSSCKTVTGQELAFEYFLNSLRLTDGTELSAFTARTGLQPRSIRLPLAEARRRKLLTANDGFLRPTPLGMRFLNDLQALFLPASG